MQGTQSRNLRLEGLMRGTRSRSLRLEGRMQGTRSRNLRLEGRMQGTQSRNLRLEGRMRGTRSRVVSHAERGENVRIISARRADSRERRKMARRDDTMRDHYDFSGGRRGKYAARYAEGTNVVVLDSITVNEGIRTSSACQADGQSQSCIDETSRLSRITNALISKRNPAAISHSGSVVCSTGRNQGLPTLQEPTSFEELENGLSGCYHRRGDLANRLRCLD